MVAALKAKARISEDAEALLLGNFTDFEREIFRNQVRSKLYKAKGFRYSEIIKRFSIALHYHSPSAYAFLRKRLHLPDVRSIQAWLLSVDCKPGILQQALLQLQKRAEEDVQFRECCLALDSMSLAKDAVLDRREGHFVGFPDYGGGQRFTGGDNLASEALVCLATGLRRQWKVIVGYLFVVKADANLLLVVVRDMCVALQQHGRKCLARYGKFVFMCPGLIL